VAIANSLIEGVTMTRTYSTRALLTALCATFMAASVVATVARGSGARSETGVATNPIVSVTGGKARGLAVGSTYAFRGLPYAAAPTGARRWRPPQSPAPWHGLRDATHYAATCPQAPTAFAGPGPFSEDCLYLNVSTSTLRANAKRPVLVWIHGGGFTGDTSTNYDSTKLAQNGLVVVTMNYRLGALGFLAHPALAVGGSAGNYGLMDQQAALRWVQSNIAQFGGNPQNVTIAGQSAGGVAVLEHLVSRGSRGLFQRAIVQSGAFALNQRPLAVAEAAGKTFAATAGCNDQTAECLRSLPVDALVKNFGTEIPGIVDGKVLTEPIGKALAAGRFAHVPVLDGMNHNEEFLFVFGQHLAVAGGTFVPVPAVSAETYQSAIASVLGVSSARASAIAAQYPIPAGVPPAAVLSTLVSDASFACPAQQVDRWTSKYAPTFAYQFDDDSAPQRFAPPGALPPIATHSSEVQYLFDQPNDPVSATLNAAQAKLAATMRSAWARFAATGSPSTAAVNWSPFKAGSSVLSLASPRPQLETSFNATHHCSFWSGS
jgi:para-nitrobenzyl esterase